MSLLRHPGLFYPQTPRCVSPGLQTPWCYMSVWMCVACNVLTVTCLETHMVTKVMLEDPRANLMISFQKSPPWFGNRKNGHKLLKLP